MRDKSKRLTVINTGSDRFDGYTDKEIRKLVSSGSNIVGGESGSSSEGLSGKYLSSETYDEAKGVINFLEGLMIDGRLVDGLLRERDTENATDTNIMTSSRIAKELSKLDDKYLRKDKDDRSSGMISSNKGFEVGNYVSGASGAIIYKDAESGQTVGELDKLYVRMKAYFETLEIVNVNTIGGKQILSPGGSVKCLGVEETEDAYRCYFLAELDGEKIENRFVVNDQIYSQTFDAVEGVSHNVSNHYFWRLCTAVAETEVEFEGKKCWWIDLSKTDADNAVWNSDIPVAGDILNQRGNRTDIDRMNFIEQSSVDAYSPNITLFHGVNSYSLDGKEYVSLGVDKSSNKAFMNVYGSMYVGDRNKKSYMKYTPEDGLEINGRLNIGVKLGDTPLKDLISAASPEGYQEFIEKVTGDIEGLQQQIDGAIESYFYQYSPSLENYPAASWNTDDKKKAHLNDTFTNLNDGRSWRWTVNNGVYGWTEITDTATAQALALAGKAKDTADGKRRVFTKTPYPPYDEGDLWAGGSTSPLKVCVKSKTETQLFDESDWAYADNTEKLRDEMSTLVSTTKTELNTSIASTKTAMEGYTDNAKKALQQSIDLLESTKADIDNVYSIADADGKISAAEADAIKKAEELADAARALAETNVQAWADGEISDAEQRAIEEAQKRVDAAKSELEAAIAEIDSKYANLVAETKGELNNEIGKATVAANNYTDAAKTALQGAIDELNKAKANISEVYSIAEADGKISASEEAAINAAKEQADAAIALSETTIKAYADGVVDKEEAARIKQAEENLAAAKQYAEEKAKEARDEIKNSYLFQALTEAPGTTIENGLILSSLIQLRDQGGNIKSGINGTINDSKGDKSIANWWGGNMDDMTDYYTWDGTQWVKKSGVTVPSDLPKGLIRMDGTGYLAKGKFWWDADGKIYADPTALFLMFDVEDEASSLSQTILALRDKQTEFTDMWEIRTDKNGNKYLYSKRPLATQGGVTMYADDGTLDLPSIYDGLPIDGTTIVWDGKVLKAVVESGLDESQLEQYLTENDYATEDWVKQYVIDVNSGTITAITKPMVVDALGYTPYDESNPKGFITSSALSGYATTSSVNTALNGKVDKVNGKGLSTEDFTTALKTKLEGLNNYNDTALSNAINKLRNDFDTLVDGDASEAIDTFNEIIAFLDGVQDNESLDSIIASIEQQIAAKYTKPSGGIPKGDLAQAVQTSLGKADTALQSETDPIFSASAAAGIKASDISNWNSKTSNVGTITEIKMNGASKGKSGVIDLGTVITAHQDISGKADKSSLATVATSGDYRDLINKPVIPIVPSSLKNPNALKFGSKSYDGSSEQTITASDLGALTSHQDISGKLDKTEATLTYLPLTGGKMQGRINMDANAIQWDKASSMQLLAPSDDDGKTLRYYDGSAFKDILDANNYNSYTFKVEHQKGYNVNEVYDCSFIGISGGSNVPSGTRYGTVLTLPYRKAVGNTTPDFASQIYMPCGDDGATPNELFFRTSLRNSWNEWQKVIHSGNIGSQSVASAASASSLTSEYLSNLNNGGNNKLFYSGFQAANRPGANYATGLTIYNNELKYTYQFALDTTGDAYIRYNNNSEWQAWKQLAFTDSNVASATKLATSRLLWGQSFDGSGDVSGVLTLPLNHQVQWSDTGGAMIYGSSNKSIIIDGNVGIGTISPSYKLDVNGDIQLKGYLYSNKSGTSATVIDFQSNGAPLFGWGTAGIGLTSCLYGNHIEFRTGTSRVLNMTLTASGKLGIGTDNPSQKLHVAGIAKANGFLSDSLEIEADSSGNIGSNTGEINRQGGSIWLQYNNNKDVRLCYGGGNVGIGEKAPSAKLFVDGDILASGGITMYSQRSLKDVVDEEGLTLDQLRTIKPTRYTWKDKRDERIHIGGIADDVQKVLPEVIYKTSDGVLTMDYGNAAFAVATSLIKPVSEQEERIAELEKENKELRAENQAMRAELDEIKEQLKLLMAR